MRDSGAGAQSGPEKGGGCVKILKKAAALLLAAGLAVLTALPAAAEGFAFNWDSDDNTPETGAPHCKSLLLLNLDTDSVVYALEPDEPRPMASMTKIMSYIIAYENIPDIENTVISVPESVEEELEGTGSSEAELSAGEQFTGRDLLYMMMVPSGNNAALTLAKYVDSLNGEVYTSYMVNEDGEVIYDPLFDPTDYTGRSTFVDLMNQKAAELGCEHTHFTNPHGLHNENHYASARDMVTMTKYAMTLPGFTEVTGTYAWNYHPVGDPDDIRTAFTTNKMLVNDLDAYGMSYYYQSATGIKTGSLDEAGYCITASATAFGYTYIAVAMGSPMVDEDGDEIDLHGEMLDVRSLFRWAFYSLEKKTVAVQGEVISDVALKYAWKKDRLQLTAGENAAVMLPGTVEETSILKIPDVPDSVEAPIRKGEQVGTVTLSYAGETIAVVPLVAAESVAKSEALQVLEQGQQVLTAPWFLVIMAVIVALVIVYIILIFVYRRKQRQLRRVRRFRDM